MGCTHIALMNRNFQPRTIFLTQGQDPLVSFDQIGVDFYLYFGISDKETYFNSLLLYLLLKHFYVLFFLKATQEGSWNHEAYLLFPVHLDGTLLDNSAAMKSKKEFFSTTDVLQIFREVNGNKTNFSFILTFFVMQYIPSTKKDRLHNMIPQCKII